MTPPKRSTESSAETSPSSPVEMLQEETRTALKLGGLLGGAITTISDVTQEAGKLALYTIGRMVDGVRQLIKAACDGNAGKAYPAAS